MSQSRGHSIEAAALVQIRILEQARKAPLNNASSEGKPAKDQHVAGDLDDL
jgi:hypothetical protein